MTMRLSVAAGAAAALLAAAADAADGYPSKPIRLVVGFTAGGSADASARMVAARMGEALRTTIVVENRGGAAGNVAAQITARAPADGYTLLWSSPGALTISRIIEKALPYDPERAFAPIGLAWTFCNALVARPDAAWNSVAQFIAAAKERPGQINYGTQGIGSAGNLSGEMLRAMAGVVLAHVPYKGGSDVMTALIGGEIPVAFASSTTAVAMRSRVRVLAVTSLARDPSLPDVPSLHEAGVPGYDASFWFGLLAPAGTPPAVLERLNRLLREALADPEVQRPARAQGLNPAPSTPREFTARIQADYVKWKRVIGNP